MRKEQQQKIRFYLQSPNKYPRPLPDQKLHFVYLITYLGEMFIQGYRIIQQFGDVIILSLMEFQISEQLSLPEKRNTKKLPSKYRAILWQYDQEIICSSASERKNIFSKLLQVSSFFPQIDFNIIYLHTVKYSILNRVDLERGSLPTCKNYYKKIEWIEQKNGFKPLQQKQEGIELHRLAQIYIKGAGQARNVEVIRRMQDKKKFYYDLFNVIHTVCYIVGKEMLENDYQAISSQKWMRFTTEKRFKRYDLLLRNQQKTGILDWKFSKLQAEQKIKGNGVKNKNKLYYQLAYKDFRTDVQLKFYCIHSRIIFSTYHYITCASYFHKIPIEEIDKMDQYINIEPDEDSIVEIENQLVEMIDNQPGEEYEATQKKDKHSKHNQAKKDQGKLLEVPKDIIQIQIEQQLIVPESSSLNAQSSKNKSIQIIDIDDEEADENKSIEFRYTCLNNQLTAKKFEKKSEIKMAKFQMKFIDLTL